MSIHFRIHHVVSAFLIIISLTSISTAASLAPAWKEPPVADGSFFDVMFSADGSTVYAGGNQMFVRSWDGTSHWGGRSGTVATMSSDGNYVVSAAGDLVQVLDRNGSVYWIRGMGAPIRAVAISSDASLIISADERGDIHSWKANGDSWGLNRSDLVKQIAVPPSGSYVVVTTATCLKYLAPDMTPIWWDNKSGSLDSFIGISSDSSTVITSGEKRVSSHTSSGALNWMKDVTREAIIDMACSEDCSTIVLGSQDGKVWVLDQQGEVLWTHSAGSWINGVGVSRDGSVIAAGALDGTLYIMDHNGNLLAKTRTQSVIQQRSVAVNGDGNRIVFADEYALYGYNFIREPEMTPENTITSAPLTSLTSPAPVTTMSVTIPSTKITPWPSKTSTPGSAFTPYTVIVAFICLFLLVRDRTR
jgi:WD40 repeat protein